MTADVTIKDGVEGLSVAAVSYVVGLFGYLVKAAHDEGVPADISLATALSVRSRSPRSAQAYRGRPMRRDRF